MNGYFSKLSSDRIVKRSFLGTIVLLVFTGGILGFFYRNLPPLVPVFNQLPWGVDRLGNRITITFPFLLAVIVFLANVIFSQAFYEKMPLVIRMLSITTLFISFAAIVFVFRTLLIIL